MSPAAKWGIGLAAVAGILWISHSASAAPPIAPVTPPKPPTPPPPSPSALPDPPRLGGTVSSPGNQPKSWVEVVLTKDVSATPLDVYNEVAGGPDTIANGTHLFVFSALADPSGAIVMDYSGQSWRIMGDLRTLSKEPLAGTTKFPIKPLVLT